MQLETERLFIVPLTLQQVQYMAEDIQELEKDLPCIYEGEPIEGALQNIVEGQLRIIAKNKKTHLYHTFWLIIRKSDKIAVGSACFKGAPDENGETEIGYGLGENHTHNGYMAETVQAMCNWALAQSGVNAVIAETEKGNTPSENVLKRCGFVQYKQSETNWWRLTLN